MEVSIIITYYYEKTDNFLVPMFIHIVGNLAISLVYPYLLQLDFIVKNTEGMKYFEDLGASSAEPVYTRVWGRIECFTKTTTVQEETAFGEAAVRTYERKTKEWVVTGTAKVPYDFGDENILTEDELKKAMQDRETYLADVKKRAEDYRASKAAASTSTTSKTNSTAVKAADFNF